MGMIFDIKRFALHDGPGIRTTVFFKGCDLECRHCHNPESQDLEKERIYRQDRCLLCKACVEGCGVGALSVRGERIEYAPDRCVRCGSCSAVCCAEATEMVGYEMSPSEIVEAVERDRVFYDESGGGVTISGGEPLIQPEFLAEILEACKEKGLHTALDTSGHADWEVIDSIQPNVDLFLYDLKLMDGKRHRTFTGITNASILKNLKNLSERRQDVVIRFPLIPGINDDEENLKSLGAFAASLPHPPPVDMLPYHRAGMQKYARLDRTVPLEEILPAEDEDCRKAARILSRFGLEVRLEGENHDPQNHDSL
ncbi:MAG: glycyl-radical enzyme activating protein [Planctomycetota bacterium]|jgi:pyruvate formate lyase activating enzyme